MNFNLFIHQQLSMKEESGWSFSQASNGHIKIYPPQKMIDKFGLNEKTKWEKQSVEEAIAFIDGMETAFNIHEIASFHK
jgi:hypothetical protein